jgi:hypothetical protein
MEKFDSFYLCRISRKENNLIQTPVYTLSIFHAKKVVLRNVGNFEVHIY